MIDPRAASSSRAHAESGGVIKQLIRVRRRLRAWLLVDGAARVVAFAALAFLVIGVADYWLVFPWMLRATTTIALILVLLTMTDRRVVRPLVNRIPLREIASKLARRRAGDADRLASIVDRAEGRADGAPELWDRVEAEADAAVAANPINTFVSPRRPLKAVAAAAASLVTLMTLSLTAPAWMHTAWLRLIWPPGAAAWPSRVGIDPLTRSAKVARGEPFNAEMRVVRGGSPDLRAFLVVSEKGRSPQRLMMRLDPDGIYRRAIEGVTADTTFWFESGDASTAATPDLLRVVDRPTIRRMTAEVMPPPYVRDGRPWIESLDDRRMSVVQGSRVSILAEPTKPPKCNAAGVPLASIRFDDGSEVPLGQSNGSDVRLHGEFVADTNRRFEIAMTDRDGLASGPQPAIEVEVKPDEPPNVAIVAPPAMIEASPAADVTIRVAADDDFGLKTLRLEYGIADRPPIAPIDLRGIVSEDAPATRLTAEHVLHLADLKARPGDTIEYRAFAADEAIQNGKPREPVRTPLYRIRVVEPADLAERFRGEYAALHAQIRAVLAAEEMIRDRTSSVVTPAMPSDDADDAANSALEGLAGQQRGVITRARQLATRFDDLADRVRSNALKLADLIAAIPETSKELVDIAAGPMTTAAELLSQSTPAASLSREESVGRTLVAESDAITRLNRLLEAAGTLRDLPDVVRKLRELLDRQESLTQAGNALARRTAGAASETLPAAERNELSQASREQDRLADEARRAVRRIGELAGSTADHTAATALQRAFGAADGAGVVEKMSDAARQLAENRTSRAVELQHEAETALRAVLASLEAAPIRQLEELTKQLADLQRRIERIIAAQQRLIDDNRASQAENPKPSSPADESAERLRRQSERQSSLASTTAGLTRRPEPRGESGDAVRSTLANAADRMKQAAGKLDSGEEKPALDNQRAAIEALQQAREQLQKSEEKAADELSQRSLDAIRNELVRIRNEQEKLRVQTRSLAAGSPTRASRIKSATLASQQTQLVAPLQGIKKRMGSAIVYVYVCDDILKRMESSAASLKAADRDKAVATQTRIVQDLSRLIDAIAEIRKKASEARFAESSASAGQGESGSPDRPVPPIAELRVLRLLQSELNDRTVDASRAAATADSDLTDLGQRQHDLLDLAKKMMDRARAQQEKK